MIFDVRVIVARQFLIELVYNLLTLELVGRPVFEFKFAFPKRPLLALVDLLNLFLKDLVKKLQNLEGLGGDGKLEATVQFKLTLQQTRQHAFIRQKVVHNEEVRASDS